MSRLTQSDRATLRRQLLEALIPDRSAELSKLADAAFTALVTDFYTPAGLKRIAALPDEWLHDVSYVDVGAIARPDGPKWRSRIHASTKRRLPRGLPADYIPKGAAAGDAALKYFQAKADASAERDRIGYQVDTILNRSTTLEAVLQKLPAARNILNLPPAASADAVAAELNVRLAKARGKKA